MEVTLLGMVTEVRLVQLSKAASPIDVRLLGKDTDVRLEQPRNARSSIRVTVFGIIAVTILGQALTKAVSVLSL